VKPALLTLPARMRGRGRRVSGVAVSALSATAVLCAVVYPGGAAANPGAPDSPAVLFGEDFEHNPAAVVSPVTSYQGAPPANETYTTDPEWAPDTVSCNGWITAFSNAGICVSSIANGNVRLMARKLGIFAGDPTPDDNHVVSAYTDQGRDPGPNKIELETAKPLTLPGTGSRFLVFSADAAETNCAAGGNQPALLAFFLLTGSDEIPLATAPSNVCTKGGDLGDGVRGGRITSDGSVLFSGSQLRVRLRNAQGSGFGNDHAFDNILVSDASPQLDKAFGSASVTRGKATALTFTVTNTTDLTAKNGWSFTDTLPTGLRIADPNDATTTCPAGVVTAAPGTQTVKATGNLASGQPSCTVTVSVVGVQSGKVPNGADQLATVGLREPARPATVTVAEPTTGQSARAACSDGKDNDGDGKVDRKDPGCVINGRYLPFKNSEAGIAPLAQCARGDLRLTDVYGRGRRTVLGGVAGPESVGAKVAILSASGTRVATATVRGDLSFRTTAALPPKAIRTTNAARFQARLGRERSLRLKFARRMTATVARLVGPGRVQISGRVTAPLARPVATVLVRASSRCRGRFTFRGPVVARGIRVQPSGRWTATITLPASLRGTRVFMRAETRVRKTTRNPKRFRTFSLMQGVALR
jgi:uncharacterized repeat protein (TIGR01451 family)